MPLQSDPSPGSTGTDSANLMENNPMETRLKLFTFVSGHGETLVDPPTEDHVNEWLSTAKGKIVSVTQSESQRSGGGHHITVGIWYTPEAQAPAWEVPNSNNG